MNLRTVPSLLSRLQIPAVLLAALVAISGLLFGQQNDRDDSAVPFPYLPFIDTSLLMNGQFKLGSDFWDKPDLQLPVGGELAPYDPDNDPGFHTYQIAGNTLIVDPGEVVQQRILLSPGFNRVSGWYALYQRATNRWSAPMRFDEMIHNHQKMHLMDTFYLEARENKRTIYANIQAYCPTPAVTSQGFLNHIEAELKFILDLHADNIKAIDAGPDSAFPYQGLHAWGKYIDFRDLDTFTPYYQTMNVPSPHAQLYLAAAQNNMTDYDDIAYQYALGVLSALGKSGDLYLPYRYVYNQQVWVAPQAGQTFVLTNLLRYLCACADFYKDYDFFLAAYLVAKQMIDNNWWKQHNDPEGLFFISNTYELEASGALKGKAVFRTPATYPGASVGEENDDHRLMLGTAAISRFTRVMVENAELLQYAWEKDPFMLECFQAISDSVGSFTVYSDAFTLNWIVSHDNPALLTAGWWSNYDRRDDFAGYNLGLGLVPILVDQSRIFGYEALASQYWVQRLFDTLESFQVMWDENARRGGREAADTYRYYQCFRDLREIDDLVPWSDAYLSTYFAGFVQLVKGFVHDGEVPEIGTWEIWDFAPYKSFFAKEVTVPGVLYSWAADVYAVSQENNDSGQWMLTVMDAVLNTIQQTARGEAGYEKDMSIPTDQENGGEFRLATGLFDMKAALDEYGP